MRGVSEKLLVNRATQAITFLHSPLHTYHVLTAKALGYKLRRTVVNVELATAVPNIELTVVVITIANSRTACILRFDTNGIIGSCGTDMAVLDHTAVSELLTGADWDHTSEWALMVGWAPTAVWAHMEGLVRMEWVHGGMNPYTGMGPYSGCGPGMGMGPLNPDGTPSLTQTFEATAQSTFALIQSIVHTLTGTEQMLESTFMATQSSFFAMITVCKAARRAWWLKATLAGRPTETGGFNHYEFREFINGKPVQRPTQKASKKLLILFLLVVVLQERAVASGGALPGQLPPLDPASLTFVRVKYACTPSNPNELELKGDEIVAVMGKLDQRTGAEVDPRLEVEGEWWRGRTRQGGG
ncbi:hypothetical protein K443DRAFT_121794 [Laccaria amethystina LaAM-08-1]|uniref:Peroxisomal membrane protein PEX13 n=1 Tax=Laccaria amethystina LaAM-08-1 TaxID=1095629 RepID=A0A0C9XYH9_9AGAR|nr:hypothetical protein K443DRAFT_121794 [Laccaria amethystina LaAM-08-1]